MKILILVFAIITALIGVKILDDIEGEDATILGMIFIIFGVFLGVITLLSFPPM